MQKLFIAALSMLAVIASFQANARSNERTGVSTGTMIMGGKLLFAAIEREMYNECQEQSADMWDMEPQDREYHFKCIQVFKDYRDTQGLKLYRKTEALAKTSYSKLKRALVNDSAAAGGSSEPPEGCDAHHIVPEHEGRKWAKDAADSARSVLAQCNIDLNSPDNGVFLPNGRKYPTGCVGAHHTSLHTRNYYEKIQLYLETASESGGCDAVKNMLNEIKQNLINGSL